MIQTLLRNAFGVGGHYRYERTEYHWGAVHFYLRLAEEALRCPQCRCGDDVIHKGLRYRWLQSVPIGLKPVYLVSEVARCRCQVCELTFEVPPPFARAQVRYTRKLEKLVEQLSRLMTLLDVAELTALNWDTVKDIVKRRLRRDYGRIDLKGVRYLSIDEIYVGKRRGFYTLVMDLESGRILWVSQGRGKAGLQGFWPRLRRCRVRIRAVAMDMSGAYWAAVVAALPEAAVVFDKFHIIQLMNQRLDELRRELVREAEGPLKLVIKGTRYLLLTRAANLKDEQLPMLERALKLNEPLSQAWYLKEELALLWEQSA